MVAQAGHPAAELGAPVRQGWLDRAGRAVRFGIADRDTVMVALSGFLIRGGILILLVPSLVLPTVIGLAAFTGVDAFGIDGRASVWLVEMAMAAALAAAAWLVAAFVVGSIVDVWLIEAELDPNGHSPRQRRPLPDRRMILDLAAIRAFLALPLIAAILWASSRVYTSTYNELTAPGDLSSPFVWRVFQGAADGFLVIGVAWLVTETLGAIAIRRAVLLDRGVYRSIAEAALQLLRRPVSSAATIVGTLATFAVAALFAIAATSTAFDWVRIAVRTSGPTNLLTGLTEFAVLVGAALVLGFAWVAALAVSGVASAWRSAAFTEETADAAAGHSPN